MSENVSFRLFHDCLSPKRVAQPLKYLDTTNSMDNEEPNATQINFSKTIRKHTGPNPLVINRMCRI